ncbi:MAG: IS1634 family transposase [Alphaproteobacteria bacterium GM202ARS2]|nr:IS1634 family transposase [Alphaproteobacteria bacterium GM202ARS2]
MFVRERKIKGYSYLYLVETVREGKRTKQRIIKNLGRKDVVLASGGLERLAASLSRFADTIEVRDKLDKGKLSAHELEALGCKRIGAPLLFGRLWEETGCAAVFHQMLKDRGFEFSVERAVLTTVLHRIMVSGSDRACEKWLADYAIPHVEGLALHHFYHAMAWLGEELGASDQTDATPFSPRTIKDEIEERLYAQRRDLFTDLSVVFMDTTSLSFEGQGGETLGRHGHSKDKRPDLKQMILAAVIDNDGRPICSEMMPGNTADVSILLPIVDRLHQRFGIKQVCVVADRGMISAATIKALEDRQLDYILGVRERSDKIVRETVLDDPAPFTPLLIERSTGETQLFAKEVTVKDRRYVVCRNEAEAKKDREDRQAVIQALDAQLKKGEKTLIGNSAYRRYLKRTANGDQKTKAAFEIDAGKLADEARFDGVFVLRLLKKAKITPLQAALRYRDLLQVEELFRSAKSLLKTRPVYHSSDAAIRGHVFCSFLALVLRKELQARCEKAGIKPEWQDTLRDLGRLQEVTILQDGDPIILRPQTQGAVGSIFKAAGIALPKNIRPAQS